MLTSKIKLGGLAAGLSCLVVGNAVAQQQIQPQNQREGVSQQQDATNPQGQSDRATTPRREYTAQFRGTQPAAGANQEVQKYLASCLLFKNQAEVEFGELAQQKAQNPKVKEFAQMMIEDHRQVVQKLQSLAGAQSAKRTETSATFEASSQNDADATRAPGSPGANQQDTGRSAAIESVERDVNQTLTADRAPGQNAALQQLSEIERQISERCKEALRAELDQKEGAEFDKCYVGSQVAGHMQMVAALDVISQQGPEQLQQIAQDAQPKVQKHLDHAKQLMKQLESDGAAGNRAARQPERTQR